MAIHTGRIFQPLFDAGVIPATWTSFEFDSRLPGEGAVIRELVPMSDGTTERGREISAPGGIAERVATSGLMPPNCRRWRIVAVIDSVVEFHFEGFADETLVNAAIAALVGSRE